MILKRQKKLQIQKNKYNHEKNNFIKIAEIGLNHLGSEVIAKKYLNYLINTNVDGISFQIKNEEFNKKFKLATNKNSTNYKIKKFFRTK